MVTSAKASRIRSELVVKDILAVSEFRRACSDVAKDRATELSRCEKELETQDNVYERDQTRTISGEKSNLGNPVEEAKLREPNDTVQATENNNAVRGSEANRSAQSKILDKNNQAAENYARDRKRERRNTQNREAVDYSQQHVKGAKAVSQIYFPHNIYKAARARWRGMSLIHGILCHPQTANTRQDTLVRQVSAQFHDTCNGLWKTVCTSNKFLASAYNSA